MKLSLPHTLKAQIAVILVIIATALASSCTSRKAKADRRNLIPEKDMVILLGELYLADGLMSLPEIHMRHQMKDSVVVHMEVLANYGYTKEQMDKTLRYYFVSNPKKLHSLYDKALASLTEIQSILTAESEQTKPVNLNLWPDKLNYLLPENGVSNPVYFDYPLQDTGLYVLRLSVVVFPDDQSDNPRITVWYWKADSTANGVFSYWDEIPFPKDGIANTHELTKRVPDSTFTHLRGWLLNHDAKPGHWEKHARIRNVVLTLEDESIPK